MKITRPRGDLGADSCQKKGTAETYLGEEANDTLVMVPAYRNDSQRRPPRTRERWQGNMLRIINELTADALHMTWTEDSGERNALNHDMKRGTFDVSCYPLKLESLR